MLTLLKTRKMTNVEKKCIIVIGKPEGKRLLVGLGIFERFLKK
jgi:hypothetical protein